MKQSCPKCKTLIEINEKEYAAGSTVVKVCPLCDGEVTFNIPRSETIGEEEYAKMREKMEALEREMEGMKKHFENEVETTATAPNAANVKTIPTPTPIPTPESATISTKAQSSKDRLYKNKDAAEVITMCLFLVGLALFIPDIVVLNVISILLLISSGVFALTAFIIAKKLEKVYNMYIEIGGWLLVGSGWVLLGFIFLLRLAEVLNSGSIIQSFILIPHTIFFLTGIFLIISRMIMKIEHLIVNILILCAFSTLSIVISETIHPIFHFTDSCINSLFFISISLYLFAFVINVSIRDIRSKFFTKKKEILIFSALCLLDFLLFVLEDLITIEILSGIISDIDFVLFLLLWIYGRNNEELDELL